MWVSVEERLPSYNKFVRTKREPIINAFDVIVLIYNKNWGWVQPGKYEKVLFNPTHWWDESLKK